MYYAYIFAYIYIYEFNALKMIWKKTGYSGYFWEEKEGSGRADAFPVLVDFFIMRIYSCVICAEKGTQHKA